MKKVFAVAIYLLCFSGNFYSQSISEILAEQNKRPIQVGDSAPDFILKVGENSIRSFSVRRTKKITLIHFWNTSNAPISEVKVNLMRLLDHYERAAYINAAGFEIVAIGVQKDLGSWRRALEADTLTAFTHGLAADSLEDMVCRSYNITQLPAQVLVDETGHVIAINPRMADIENLLEERKSYQPIKKDIEGTLAHTTNRHEVLKNGRLRIYNYHGDSITTIFTGPKGDFYIHDLKLNQDFVLKVDVRDNLFLTSEPMAIYSFDGDLVIEGKNTPLGFVFEMTPKITNQLLLHEEASKGRHEIQEIDVIKSLNFTDDGKKLTSKSEKELNILVFDMQKNPELLMEFIVHTDSRVDELKAMEVTSNQVNTIKEYFRKKGLDLCHITGIAKGNSEPRKVCSGVDDCTEEEHRLNRRVEFILYKDVVLTE